MPEDLRPKHPDSSRISEIRRQFEDARRNAREWEELERIKQSENSEYHRRKYDRSGGEYVDSLMGIRFFFNEVLKLQKPYHSVLDAGTGSGRGIMELSKTLGKGLKVYGIGLNVNLEAIPAEFKDHFFKGQFEDFNGITAGTIGGIISCYGAFTYSNSPLLVAHKANRLLAPNGMVKFVTILDDERLNDEQANDRVTEFKDYETLFRELGYAVGEFGPIYFEPQNRKYVVGELIAIKPGPKKYTDLEAGNLLLMDRLTADEQYEDNCLLMESK